MHSFTDFKLRVTRHFPVNGMLDSNPIYRGINPIQLVTLKKEFQVAFDIDTLAPVTTQADHNSVLR